MYQLVLQYRDITSMVMNAKTISLQILIALIIFVLIVTVNAMTVLGLIIIIVCHVLINTWKIICVIQLVRILI